jgi:two-component system, NarL family, sensor kinase
LPPSDHSNRQWKAPSVGRAVAQFVLAGLAALTVFLLGSLLVLRELGRREAVRDAKDFAVLAGQGIVEPVLTDGLLENDQEALERLDSIVQERVLGERVFRVKIWTRTGRIVYSDEPRLLDSTYSLGADELAVLASGSAHADESDLERAENRFERGQGDVYEVYSRVRTPTGIPLLFETYQRRSSLVSSSRDVWRPFAAPLLLSLLLLWLVQVPLAWRLAKGLRRSQLEREALLVRVVESSTNERRRIAADLHDGVVQDLAGMSYSLRAATDRLAGKVEPELTDTLRDVADRTRGAIRQLRTLLVEIHPPNLRSAGLDAALGDLLAPLALGGVETQVDVPEDLDPTSETERFLFRGAAEALRNVQRHARARHVAVRITSDPETIRLEVVDDGVGFSEAEREQRLTEGHLGLSLLEDEARLRGGSLELRSGVGAGTSFVLELPS